MARRLALRAFDGLVRPVILPRLRLTVRIGFCLGLSLVQLAGADSAEPARSRVVQQIDHLLVESTKAGELFVWLTETLRLPVAWPMARYGRFASGGVALGNVDLEILEVAAGASGNAPNRLVGLALEPVAWPQTLAELQRRGITHGDPAPFYRRRWLRRGELLWTTVSLPSVSHDSFEVFLCEYADDSAGRREQLRRELDSRRGGPLRLRSVCEVVVGPPDETKESSAWQALLGPAGLKNSRWSIGEGPALRLTAADANTAATLILTVESLEQAKRYLQQQGWLGESQPDGTRISADVTEGLAIVLVEADAH